jgi:pimeloyl-ACP methyl ester carboxylesterase
MKKFFKRFGLFLLVVLGLLTVINLTVAKLPDEPPLPAGSKFVEVEGRRIHYVEHAGKEPAVVMIHGLPGTWGDWDAVAAKLPGRRTIQIDRPGFAFSQEGYVPFDAQVRTVHALAQELKLERPVIAGHSYGGAMALDYTYRYPDEISGTVAVDPAVSSDDISSMKEFQAHFINAMELPVLHQLGALTMSNIVKRVSMNTGGDEAFSPDERDAGWTDRALSLTARDRDLSATSAEMLHAKAMLDRLQLLFPKIRRPVEIIQGNDDELVSASSVKLAAAKMPRSHLVLLPGGHMQTYTNPQVVVDAIERTSSR